MTKSIMLCELRKYDCLPLQIKPKAITLIMISIRKSSEVNLSTYKMKVMRFPFGSYSGLSNASKKQEMKIMTKIITSNVYDLTILVIYFLKLLLVEKTHRDLFSTLSI